MTDFITTRAIRDRYATALKDQQRYRNEAAEAWYHLRWWQWRKRRRLERTLFGIGGWRVHLDDTNYEPYVPGEEAMRVIALDPGKLTGWAAADIDEVGEWTNLEHGIMSAKNVVEQLAADQGLGLMDGTWAPTTFQTIVYEDWVLYRAHADEYVGSDMPYSQQIGQYRLIAWLSETPIVKQAAARKNLALRQARSFRPEVAEKVEAIMQRQHKDGHDGDALLHLWGYTVDHYPIRRNHG